MYIFTTLMFTTLVQADVKKSDISNINKLGPVSCVNSTLKLTIYDHLTNGQWLLSQNLCKSFLVVYNCIHQNYNEHIHMLLHTK